MSMFSRLFGRPSAPDDPLVARLKELPVPLSAAGPFVEGLKHEREALHRARGTDNERQSGFVANYRLHWRRPWEATQAHIAREHTPIVESVQQKVVLLRTAEDAGWWFKNETEMVKQSEGRDIGGTRYGQMTFTALPDLGDEANMMQLPKQQLVHDGNSFHETQVTIRVGRLVGTVNATAILGDARAERQVQALAGLLARRMSEALRTAA